MTIVNHPVIQCDGGCGSETHRPFTWSGTSLWMILRAEGWHRRPKGRHICPNCWKAGHR